jgi:hypothetical protein
VHLARWWKDPASCRGQPGRESRQQANDSTHLQDWKWATKGFNHKRTAGQRSLLARCPGTKGTVQGWQPVHGMATPCRVGPAPSRGPSSATDLLTPTPSPACHQSHQQRFSFSTPAQQETVAVWEQLTATLLLGSQLQGHPPHLPRNVCQGKANTQGTQQYPCGSDETMACLSPGHCPSSLRSQGPSNTL